MNPRRTTSQRRERYYASMDAKAEARAELEAERIAMKSGQNPEQSAQIGGDDEETA